MYNFDMVNSETFRRVVEIATNNNLLLGNDILTNDMSRWILPMKLMEQVYIGVSQNHVSVIPSPGQCYRAYETLFAALHEAIIKHPEALDLLSEAKVQIPTLFPRYFPDGFDLDEQLDEMISRRYRNDLPYHILVDQINHSNSTENPGPFEALAPTKSLYRGNFTFISDRLPKRKEVATFMHLQWMLVTKGIDVNLMQLCLILDIIALNPLDTESK